MNTANDFTVSISADGKHLLIHRPPMRPIDPDAALRLAAWLVVLADPTGEKFPAVLEAVKNT